MATIITISLENDVNAALEELKRKEGIQTEEVINEAVRQYLFFRRLTLLRQRLALKAQKMGIAGEEDVFNLIS
jgi:metal-responsive CopG/Arc/MetJ family transcriptional regulator